MKPDATATRNISGAEWDGRRTSGEWTPALQGISDLLLADHAMIVAQEATEGGFLLATSAGMDRGDFARFTSPEAARWMEPFKRAMPRDAAIRWSDLVPERQFARTAFYNEVVRPANGFHAVATRQDLGGFSIFLAACRSKRSRNFTTGDAARLQSVLPLFAANLALQRRLRTVERQSTGLVQAFDRMDAGVILLDAAMRPVFVNARAQAIGAAKDGLILSADGLTASRASETKALRQAVLAAMGIGRAAGPGGETGIMTRLHLSRPSLNPPLAVSVAPISGMDIDPGLGVGAVIFVTEPQGPPVIRADRLIATFGLAPREAELATLLAGGMKLCDAAGKLGIGIGTARWYLKRVLEKTDTHRQAELIHLILHGFSDHGV